MFHRRPQSDFSADIARKNLSKANNRKARFYALTPHGHQHLTQETGRWRKLATAMARILDLEKLKTVES